MKEMDSKIHLKLIVDNYIRVCYIILTMWIWEKLKIKMLYTNYFNSLICLSETMVDYYLNDFFIHDIRNEFYTPN